jgi:arylsulfatase A-like enzyme
MTQRIGLILALLALCVSAGRAQNAPASRPNVLFVFSDDQRADTIHAWGNEHIRTPVLDQMAATGTSFRNAYCMGGNSGAICIPSRAMLLSGRSLYHVDNKLLTFKSWPEQFADAGYETFITGKWHNGEKSVLKTFQTGRAVFLGGMGYPHKMNVRDIGPDRELVNERDAGELAVGTFTDCAIDFLKTRKADRPFLCYVAFNLPHDPRVSTSEFHDYHQAHQPPLPANYLPLHPFNNGDLTVRDEQLAPWPRTEEDTRRQLADYYASVAYVDQQLGRIIDTLKSTGQFDNTIIVFAGDHGLAIGSHGLFGKQSLYDHSMHTPLLMRGPGVPANKSTDALCYLFDIFPTLGELCGVSAPDTNEGKSLAPVLSDKATAHRDALLFGYLGVQRAVRDDRWKLIVYPKINKTQLFDLRNDPSEVHDLASDPAHADDLARMMALLKRMQSEAGDEQPLTSEHPQPAEFDFTKVKRNAKAE